MTENELSNKIIGLAIEVHTILGHGLLESAYKIKLVNLVCMLKRKSRPACR